MRLRQARLISQRAVLTLLGFSMILVPGALASPAATNASGVITGSGTSYSLDLANTGTDSIQCMTLVVASGVSVSAASGPSGAAGGLLSGGSGFRFQELNIAAGASATFAFTTLAPYPVNAGGELHVSSDCKTELVVRATGPTPACNCQGLGTRVNRTTAHFTNLRRFQFQLVWTMTCTGGTGNCQGDVNIIPPLGFRLTSPRNSTISCTGTCANTSNGMIQVAGAFPRNLGTLKQRRNKTFIFAFKTFCTQNGTRVAAGNGTLTAIYTAKGLLDKRKSDLNGDGHPDGQRRN